MVSVDLLASPSAVTAALLSLSCCPCHQRCCCCCRSSSLLVVVVLASPPSLPEEQRGYWEKNWCPLLALFFCTQCRTLIVANSIHCDGEKLSVQVNFWPRGKKVPPALATWPHGQPMPACGYIAKAGSKRCRYFKILTCASISASIVRSGNQWFWGWPGCCFCLSISFSFVFFVCPIRVLGVFLLLCGEKTSNAAPKIPLFTGF